MSAAAAGKGLNCCLYIFIVIFIVLMFTVPQVMVDNDTNAWALYGPILPIFGGFACFTMMQLGAISEDDDAVGGIAFIFGAPGCLAIFVGFLIFVSHQLPYLRFVRGDIYSGTLEGARDLLSTRDKPPKKVYFKDGYVDNALRLTHDYRYTASCSGKGNQRRCVKKTGRFAIVPVFENAESAREGGAIHGWAVPYEDEEQNTNVEQDRCSDEPNGRGGLCGTPVEEKRSKGFAKKFISNYMMSNDLLIPWLRKHNRSVQWLLEQGADDESQEARRQVELAIQDIPVYIFKDPAKQRYNIGWWVTAGIIVFFAGVGAHCCNTALVHWKLQD